MYLRFLMASVIVTIVVGAALQTSAVTISCTPDFGDRAVSIVTKSGKMEWGWGSGLNPVGPEYQVASNDVAEFYVYYPLTLPGPVSSAGYHFQTARSTDVLSVNEGLDLQFPLMLTWTAGEGSSFTTTCSDCFPSSSKSTLGSDCVISLVNSSLCVRVNNETIEISSSVSL
ncbi:hypothetical protein D9757_009433 [Collybiopsis confluens]|uniref:Uncharacterized protein n=1 Tax=Collybiopsis confluens TaxID=2823264 RepID=A0A8H5M513_9AGAR|nr:hypothetical protein D9757_009433 [Collybiopsis confluens]